MKIEIEIPKEFECDFTSDKFKDFFERVMADIDCNGACGKYEKEIAKMFIDAFKNGTINNQPQTQPIPCPYWNCKHDDMDARPCEQCKADYLAKKEVQNV